MLFSFTPSNTSSILFASNPRILGDPPPFWLFCTLTPPDFSSNSAGFLDRDSCISDLFNRITCVLFSSVFKEEWTLISPIFMELGFKIIILFLHLKIMLN